MVDKYYQLKSYFSGNADNKPLLLLLYGVILEQLVCGKLDPRLWNTVDTKLAGILNVKTSLSF